MKLVVGLGNPGIEYQFTPHNLGFLTIDRIAEGGKVDVASRRCQAATAKVRLAGHEVMLAKPETFMNLSGLSVRKLVEDLGVEPAKDLIVVYDELDSPFGTIRIRYTPDELCVELKSLKLYLWSYRDEGAFHEAVTNQICDDVVAAIHPRSITVTGKFMVRGGIATTVTVTQSK